ncbi:RsmB/NOP family class I SAM-dependent RNA methyltransferase [Cognatishimia activa]|uniref:Ribosomal RNA small subunit methyltransferase B n=1 Tax=Cognatishimia activa TaxID=1715691 RepID=A0A0P1IUN0_9RHOB|nr:RsmB/NOP family class I SAM-dependent RNA methyltransferase [Cognatishimia activa]CUJ31050.1 Ribosomal RNA small subunit methyltransferase B [Cognatishimia activa]CUK27195.1 Ribosomal RNA small subunit methyltransferase B [Cognatishimia activa]
MTPAARVQTAIELLDPILAGEPAERVLTQWARASRFAGSKDRAAVRDHVYDALRQRNSAAASGGGENGRALMIGLLRLQGIDPESIFSGEGYAPSALSSEEMKGAVSKAIDLPEWIVPEFKSSLGSDFEAVEAALKDRAPVILRANLRKTTRAKATEALSGEGILTKSHTASESALEVTQGARQIRNSKTYRDGLVELQDAASQAAIDLLPMDEVIRTLDYCAGGGGKLLAMAGRGKGAFFAHDAIESRLRDLPERAKRAGVKARVLKSADLTKQDPFDLVFCDVPCSGTGTWRRDPDAKWKLTRESLDKTLSLQLKILTEAQNFVSKDGYLSYATCSLLNCENRNQIDRFLKQSGEWNLIDDHSWTPLDGCDGFYTALLKRC